MPARSHYTAAPPIKNKICCRQLDGDNQRESVRLNHGVDTWIFEAVPSLLFVSRLPLVGLSGMTAVNFPVIWKHVTGNGMGILTREQGGGGGVEAVTAVGAVAARDVVIRVLWGGARGAAVHLLKPPLQAEHGHHLHDS